MMRKWQHSMLSTLKKTQKLMLLIEYLFYKIIDHLLILSETITDFAGIRSKHYPKIQDYWFARSAFIYTQIGLLVALAYVAFYVTTKAYAAALSLGITILILMLTHPLHWFGKSRLLAIINLAATSIGLAGVVLHLGGISSSVACWLLGTPPGLAALLFRRVREIILLTVLAMLLYTGIFVLELKGYPIHQFPFSTGSMAHSIFTFLTFICFAVFIAIALSIFAFSQKKLYEALQRNKEKSELTAENIKAMFHFMKQAMFTVDERLFIANQNDQQFNNVIGSDVISLDQILDKSTLTGDQKDMTKTIIQTCVGDGAENFEFNAHHLPVRLQYRQSLGNPQQILFLQWTPIMHRGKIRSILLAIQDLTQSELNRVREEEVEIKNKFLLALLQVPVEILPMIVSNILVIGQKLDSALHNDGADMREFKTVIHTLKGNARSFGFQSITERCHEIENCLAISQSPRDPELKENFIKLRCELNLLATIYEEHLAPKSNQAGLVTVEKRELKQLVEYLKQQTPLYTGLGVLEQWAQSNYAGLLQLIRMDLAIIAQQLAKPIPEIHWMTDHIDLREQEVSVLVNVLGHLMRNCCDHGIESVAERLENNKPAQGFISIEFRQTDGEMILSVKDDGRGLDLSKIRQKVSTLGKEKLKDEQLAQHIFEADFTISQSLSSISGRGIGMAAIVEDLRSIGGEISIVFTSPERLGFRAFAFQIRWPLPLADKVAGTLSASAS